MTTHYIWDTVSDSYLMETDENGNITAEYITEPVPYGRVISQLRAGVTSFYHYDGQGSTRQLTDESGNVTDEYTYSAFGETVASTGTTVNSFRYKGTLGYYTDFSIYNQNESSNVRKRLYEISLGHWASLDPFAFIDRKSGYAYCRNNPTNLADPSGMWPIMPLPTPTD